MSHSLLMPCPFCTGRGVKIETGQLPLGVVSWIECKRCWARGPQFTEPTLRQAQQSAREAWNNRK